MKYEMNLNDYMFLYKGVFVKDLLYSTNDNIFYYNILTKGGDDLVYKYSKKEHQEIEYLKECYVWRNID